MRNDPIELLKKIREHATSYEENRYPMTTILDSLRNLLGTRQREDESLQDYTARFKSARDIAASHLGGPLILTGYVSTMVGYSDGSDTTVVEELEREAWSIFLAYLYANNADKKKYGSLLSTMNTQYSLKNDQYPKDLTAANNVLSQHRFDNQKNNPK